jgi:cell wall-associated NlpC family hydrolase
MRGLSLLNKAFIIGCMSALAITSNASASNLGVVNGTSVNLRSYNSTEAQVVSTAQDKEVVTILANANNGWFKVAKKDGSTTAFINAQYLSITQTDATCISDDVNVRCRPSTSSAPYGKASKGQVFVTTGKYEDWYQIKYNGYTGYIHKSYMQGSLLAYLPTITPAPAQTTTTTATDKNSATATDTSVVPSASTVKAADSDVYAVVNASSINLRKGAGTDSDVITTLPYGYTLNVLGSNGSWLKVSDDNKNIGYVSSTYINLKNGTKPSNEVATTTTTTTTTATTTDSDDEDSDSSADEKPQRTAYIPVKYNTTGEVDAQELIEFSKQYLGTPYVYGGTSLTEGVDCSGFIYCVYGNFGITLNRTSRDMFNQGDDVAYEDLEPGDLVFFNTGGNAPISHVGMYIGDDQYIHSTNGSANGIIISDLTSSYAKKTYVGARRILK